PTDIPTELGSASYAKTIINGTKLEFGKYFTTSTFLGLNLQAATTPGFRIEHRFGLTGGLSIESTLQPRYFLSEPTLAPQEFKKANAFGLFLIRRWRF
ncbi:MAG: hypothetical protein M3Y64_10875, partial [Gemmatimonadota bacterium]|nr:hypothetical protein [Gemmatimonadota bacterium]